MWESCLLRGRPPVLLKKVANRDNLFGFSQKETGANGVAMATI